MFIRGNFKKKKGNGQGKLAEMQTGEIWGRENVKIYGRGVISSFT